MKLVAPLKRQIRLCQRTWIDRITGDRHRFAHTFIDHPHHFQPQISVIQSLGTAPAGQLSCKKHNLDLAIQAIQRIQIPPNHIFSFWHLVKQPSRAAGYLEGRAIVGDQVSLAIGGGLCQLSGLLYLLALKAGLDILERHPHSRDLYTDATRFAPLGADATVVYGYKDLRFKNILAFPVSFAFQRRETDIQAAICSNGFLVKHTLKFRTQHLAHKIRVDTFRYDPSQASPECIDSSTYLKLESALD